MYIFVCTDFKGEVERVLGLLLREISSSSKHSKTYSDQLTFCLLPKLFFFGLTDPVSHIWLDFCYMAKYRFITGLHNLAARNCRVVFTVSLLGILYLCYRRHNLSLIIMTEAWLQTVPLRVSVVVVYNFIQISSVLFVNIAF